MNPLIVGSGYPARAEKGAPKRVNFKKDWALEFDGKGNYITFPQETLPRGSSTIEFDIKTANGNNMVLLRTFNKRTVFFSLIINKGSLFAAYIPESGKTVDIKTNLVVPLDKWTHIKVQNKLNKLIFSVNGKSYSFPIKERPIAYGSLAFGGPAVAGTGVPKGTRYFKGLLKNLHIIHK